MPSITSLAKVIKSDFSELKFIRSDDFIWSYSEQTIYSPVIRTEASLWAFMHELSHAALHHSQFQSDIELVTKESEAWQYAAANLAPKYNQRISIDYIEEQLNTYRDWLHERSLCPTCDQTGLQTKMNRYSCINCNGSWTVNDARRCSLRRYQIA